MLTLTDRDGKTYDLIFGPKIMLVKNGRVRKITDITIGKFVGRRLLWINLDMKNPNLETSLRSEYLFGDFHYRDSDSCYIKFNRHGFITGISILGHDQVYWLTFSFIMEN
jgi:hypothetical protein